VDRTGVWAEPERWESSWPEVFMRRRHGILMLSANPADTSRLKLDQDERDVRQEIDRSRYRDRFVLDVRSAVAPIDLLRELRRIKPTILHFAGHGVGSGGRAAGPGMRDVAPGHGTGDAPLEGLCFQGPDGRAQVIPTEVLLDTFAAAGRSVKMVALAACYTEPQAEALIAHVDVVIGFGGAIRDDAARKFSVSLYGAIAEGESVEVAYLQGRAAIGLEGLPDRDRPKLKVKPGVDASKLVFATDRWPPPRAKRTG
jgi:hypothetical protein